MSRVSKNVYGEKYTIEMKLSRSRGCCDLGGFDVV